MTKLSQMAVPPHRVKPIPIRISAAGLIREDLDDVVRTVGLEPTNLSVLEPKPSAYANSAMSARKMGGSLSDHGDFATR